MPYRSAAIRITEKENLTHSQIVKAIQTIARVAHKNGVKNHVWASIPCTAGCHRRHINYVEGLKTGDAKLTNTLIQNATRLCKFARVLGGHYTWEWPERCDLWRDRRVRALTSVPGFFAPISASAVDWMAIVGNKEVTVKKKLRIFEDKWCDC